MAAELSVSISEGLVAELDSLASGLQRSRDELVSVAVRRLLDDEGLMVAQMLRGIQEADAGLFIPHRDVEAWIDSLGSDHELPRPRVGKRTIE